MFCGVGLPLVTSLKTVSVAAAGRNRTEKQICSIMKMQRSAGIVSLSWAESGDQYIETLRYTTGDGVQKQRFMTQVSLYEDVSIFFKQ